MTTDPQTPSEATTPGAAPTEPLAPTEPVTPTEPAGPEAPSATVPTAADPTPAPAQPAGPRYQTRPRPMTVVWGALLAGLGLALVAWAAGARFDLLVVGSIILAVAGVALITSAVARAARTRRDDDES